jgi:hypothetical protein
MCQDLTGQCVCFTHGGGDGDDNPLCVVLFMKIVFIFIGYLLRV